MERYKITDYRGCAVYEPAEGGGYVAESHLDGGTVQDFTLDEIKPIFQRWIRDTSRVLGCEPIHVSERHARWITGPGVGNDFDSYIEHVSQVGSHESTYCGYC